MKSPDIFEFTSYDIDDKRTTLELRYRLAGSNGTTAFCERLVFPQPLPAIGKPLEDKLFFCLHLVCGISYWKLLCPRQISICSGALSQKEADFWNKLYEKGLGEFFYRNGIDFRGLVDFPAHLKDNYAVEKVLANGKILLGIGGGKDSLLAAELLEKSRLDFTGMIMETGRLPDILEDAGSYLSRPVIKVKRMLDENLLRLNSEPGHFNGHIPISAVIAFVGLTAAVFYGFSYFTVGNESSANQGNVNYLGAEINHQWSKSWEFEQLFRDYCRQYVVQGIEYFSLLRPLAELQIAELFSRYPDHFGFFVSCNRNFRIKNSTVGSRWCGRCAKCAFTYLVLSPFLSLEQLDDIFGQRLFENVALLPIYRGLLGLNGFKPFDCVGTYEDNRKAFALAEKKAEFGHMPVILRLSKEMETGQRFGQAGKLQPLHNIPPEIFDKLELK